MQVFVKPVDGKTITLDVNEDSTISDIKGLIYDQRNITIGMQKLMYQRKCLEDDHKTLKDYHINHFSQITLIICSWTQFVSSAIISAPNIKQLLSILPPIGHETTIIQCDPLKSLVETFADNDILILTERDRTTITYFDETDQSIIVTRNQLFEKKLHSIHHSFRHGSINRLLIVDDGKYRTNLMPQKSSTIILMPKYNAETKDITSNVIQIIAECHMRNIKYEEEQKQEQMLKFIINMMQSYALTEKVTDSIRNFIVPDFIKHLHWLDIRQVYSSHELNSLFMSALKALATKSRVLPAFRQYLGSLDYYINPRWHRTLFREISVIYGLLCTDNIHIIADTQIFKHLFIFMLYDDDQDTIMNGLLALNTLFKPMENSSQLPNFDDIIDAKYSDNVTKLYTAKIDQQNTIFNGYIRIVLSVYLENNHKLIPNEISSLIYQYYNCYYKRQSKFMERLLFLVIASNGYNDKVRNEALQCLVMMSQHWSSERCNKINHVYDLSNISRQLLDENVLNHNACYFTANIMVSFPAMEQLKLLELMGKKLRKMTKIKGQTTLLNSINILYSFARFIRTSNDQNIWMKLVIEHQIIGSVITVVDRIFNDVDDIASRTWLDQNAGAIFPMILDLYEFLFQIESIGEICVEVMFKNTGIGVRGLRMMKSGILDTPNAVCLRATSLLADYFE